VLNNVTLAVINQHSPGGISEMLYSPYKQLGFVYTWGHLKPGFQLTCATQRTQRMQSTRRKVICAARCVVCCSMH